MVVVVGAGGGGAVWRAWGKSWWAAEEGERERGRGGMVVLNELVHR